MHLANEILNFLVCEVCFEHYNERKRVPISLFPCGHTYCESCVVSLNTNQCPACKSAIQFQTKNWALINLIPRAQIPAVFGELQQLVTSGLELLRRKRSEADLGS